MQNIHECFRQKYTIPLFDRVRCTFCAYLCVYAIYRGVYTSVWFAVDRYFFDLAHGEALYYTFLFIFSSKNCTQLQHGSRRQGELHLNCCSCKLLGVKVSRVFCSLATFTLSPRTLYTFLSTLSFLNCIQLRHSSRKQALLHLNRCSCLLLTVFILLFGS